MLEGVSHDHAHAVTAKTDRRWLLAALVVIVLFMAGEVTAGILAHSLALITDAGHMVTDAAAIGVAVIAARIARRPAQGAYTYGFARVDALSGQLNGMTLLLLATWFGVLGVRRLIDPAESVHGGVVGVVAIVGIAVNLLATWFAGRANRASLNVRGVLGHLLTDLWAFLATFAAGIVIVVTGWVRADAVASLIVAALMTWTGWRLVRAAGRVLLEAAPKRVDPFLLGQTMAAVDGVAQVHDLHVWQLGSGADAVSAHVLVSAPYDCHEVSARLRALLADDYRIGHVTLQADHADAPEHDAGDCAEAHGEIHIAEPQ